MDCYKEALQSRLGIYGKCHLNVAATYYNLGQTFYHKGKLDLAINCYLEFLEIVHSNGILDNPDIAKVLISLGNIY